MKNNKYILFWLILFLFVITGCGSTVCLKKDNPKHGISFNYENLFGHGYVDIGALPTFTKNDKWVKKLIVKNNGFLLVSSQNMASCKNKSAIEKAVEDKLPLPPCERIAFVKYQVRRYIEDRGYEEWDYFPEEEWPKIKSLEHEFSKPADYFYEDCSYNIFGSLYMFLEVLDFV